MPFVRDVLDVSRPGDDERGFLGLDVVGRCPRHSGGGERSTSWATSSTPVLPDASLILASTAGGEVSGDLLGIGKRPLVR